MALNPSFALSQILGIDNTLVVTDTSTGSDVLVVSRRVSLQIDTGGYLVPSGNPSSQYISWALADTSISLAVLNQDYAIQVTVDWLDAGGSALYTSTTLTDTTQYLEQEAFNLVESESSDPSILQDDNYLMNALRLRKNIDDANIAVSMWGNITVSQSALNRGTYLVQNANCFF